ncbi:MAG: hypothetical protein CR974_01940 [Gammaproteobacteria bacterium]|nr:MAG: hypothetical protein CR974_01940 [Gammaproteobacteria bacterium]
MILKLLRYTIYFALVVSVFTGLCYGWVVWRAKDDVYQRLEEIPKRRVGLVLGTSKYLFGKVKNQYYHNRIDAAVRLYQAGKVEYFVVSGDNRRHDYNEPKQMKADLIAAGVPAERIQPDYAGFRTLDSVLRMDKVFGHKDYVIISQRFHNQRAVFLARAHGQQPIAFDAADPQSQGTTKVKLREILARVKAVLDIVTNKQAKFYGEPIAFPPPASASETVSVDKSQTGN